MYRLKFLSKLLFSGALFAGFVAVVQAHDYPSKPIRAVVPFPPGGSTDTVTRLVGNRLSVELGQPVIVENKPGAGGSLGVKEVLKAPADGHTLLFTPMGAISIAPSLYENIGYKAGDLAPVAVLFRAPFFLTVAQDSPFQTAQELLEAGKSERPPMYGSSGNGALSHVLGEALNQAAGTSFGHVPYKGGAPLLKAVSANEAQWALLQAADSKGFVDAGRLKPLMVLSSNRSRPWPEVPTSEELGLKGMDLRMWNGVFAPSGTPTEIIDILNQKISAILAEPEIQARLQSMAVDDPEDENDPDAFRRQISREAEAFAKIIADNNLKVN